MSSSSRVTSSSSSSCRTNKKKGRGLLNKLIDSLPFEAHIPGDYRYCGPGTRLEERLKRGDPGINPLDEACKLHDIAYSKTSDTVERNKADLQLADRAWQRVKASDSSLGERAAAYAVTNAMKLKAKLGMGLSNTSSSPSSSSSSSKKKTPAKKKKTEQKKKVNKKKTTTTTTTKKKAAVKSQKPAERIIPIPKTGAGLKNLLTGIGLASRTIAPVAQLIKTVIAGFQKKKNVHVGGGVYLRPYRQGYGLYLKPYRSNLN